jgi:predicted permease
MFTLDGWWSDVRYAARTLRASPVFTVVAVLSLAIGVGANTTIFSLASSLLLRDPAGLAEPDRLVDIGRSRHGAGFDNGSYPNYSDLRERNAAFTDVAAYRIEPRPYSLTTGSDAERLYGVTVSGNYFDVLGTRPAAGRTFSDRVNRTGPDSHEIVISHRLWQRRFHGERSVVGRDVTLNGDIYTIVGIAPEGFQGTAFLAPDFWIPLHAVTTDEMLKGRQFSWLVMVGRLRPAVTVAQARANGDAVAAQLAREYPNDNRDVGFTLNPSSRVPGPFATPVKAFIAFLMAITGLVLLVACVNVAGMLLARAAARRREVAVRLAVGAGRYRIVRQLLTESILLFVLAGSLGLLVSSGISRALLSLVPALPVPVSLELPVDWRVMSFAAMLSLGAGVLSGLVPALQTASPSLLPSLKQQGDDVSLGRLRVRSVLVAGQVAVSVVVLVVAGLFVRSLQNALSHDPGFDARDMEVVSLDMSIGGFGEVDGAAFQQQLLERARTLPGVTHATWSRVLPLTNSGFSLGGVMKEGERTPEKFGHPADWNIVSPEYFETLRLPIVRGRGFSAADRQGTPPVMIVNETLARQFWPGEDPLGKTIVVANPIDGTTRYEVIGVARNAKYRSLGDEARLFVYVPLAQRYMGEMDLILRTAVGQSAIGDVRTLLRTMAPTLPIVNAMSYGDYVAINLLPQRIAVALAGTLGLVGLMLAAIGVYGVTAYAVARRTREIGVRIALGADRRDVRRLIVQQGVGLGAIGIAIGGVLALAASQVLGSLLLGVSPADPLTFVAITLLFLGTTLLATWAPARRAMAIDPVRALRAE